MGTTLNSLPGIASLFPAAGSGTTGGLLGVIFNSGTTGL